MIRPLFKHAWQASPQLVRLAAMWALCLLSVERRGHGTAGGEPVYVCGAFYSSSGLAQSARLYAEDVERAGRQALPVDITAAMMARRDFQPRHAPMSLEQVRPMTGHGTVVVHANPPYFQLALCRLGKEFLKNKRVVGYWAWELEAVPAIWRQALEYVDEVQVPSRFVQQVLQRHTTKPVLCVPHAVRKPKGDRIPRVRDGVVRCLFIFDGGVSFERKNPLAALQAFALAFQPGEAELTFKVSNRDADNGVFADFQRACAVVPGVRIVTDALSDMEMDDLYQRHDIYVSLHRSEGYGLTIREAMLHGLQVVATGWSGNMDFMQGETCHAVPYRLVPVRVAHGPYKGLRARWAEPDVDAAAGILRDVRRKLLGGVHA